MQNPPTPLKPLAIPQLPSRMEAVFSIKYAVAMTTEKREGKDSLKAAPHVIYVVPEDFSASLQRKILTVLPTNFFFF